MSKYRSLLKEATSLKRQKLFDEACVKLREAYDNCGDDVCTISERLRLPSYLQLAGRRHEAVEEYDNLLYKFKFCEQPEKSLTCDINGAGSYSIGVSFNLSVGNLAAIYGSMSLFFKREKDFDNHFAYHIFSYVMTVVSQVLIIESMHKFADDSVEAILGMVNSSPALLEKHLNYEKELSQRLPVHAYTDKGNPIRDVSYPHLKKSVEQKISKDFISQDLKSTPVGKTLNEKNIQDLCTEIIHAIDKADLSSNEWQFRIIGVINKSPH